ncbi:MAG: ParA family protein [Anaerolineae bacterium]|nr:ParA family protein [Anaerolineae bacterium]
MTQVISFLNLAQGGGKTTSVVNLATALKRRGHSVLAVDLNADEELLHRIRLPNPGRAARPDRTAKILLTLEGWHLMPGGASVPLLHARIKQRLTSRPGYYDELASMFDAYDYVLVDCSTTERAVVIEALALTNTVIVPLDSEAVTFHDSLDRIADLIATGNVMNPELEFGGVFLAHYSPRFRRAREMLTTVLEVLGPVNCFSAYLTESAEIRQAERRRTSVIADAPTSQAAHAFYRLAEQLTNAAEPSTKMPLLMMMPGRAKLDVGTLADEPFASPIIDVAPAADATPVYNENTAPNWRERAESSADLNQAVRYAVLGLVEQPDSADALEVFETCLIERIETVRYAELDRLVELGNFVGENGLDHYAAQLFRRATELNPAHAGAWAGLARVTQVDEERVFALEQCLGLDRGMTAAEAPAPARRRNVYGFVSMQPA